MSDDDDEDDEVDIFEGLSVGLYQLEDEEKVFKRKVFQNGGIIVQLPTDQVNIIISSLDIMDEVKLNISKLPDVNQISR
jgi:hypothetical protein